jgi:hypothetical protein
MKWDLGSQSPNSRFPLHKTPCPPLVAPRSVHTRAAKCAARSRIVSQFQPRIRPRSTTALNASPAPTVSASPLNRRGRTGQPGAVSACHQGALGAAGQDHRLQIEALQQVAHAGVGRPARAQRREFVLVELDPGGAGHEGVDRVPVPPRSAQVHVHEYAAAEGFAKGGKRLPGMLLRAERDCRGRGSRPRALKPLRAPARGPHGRRPDRRRSRSWVRPLPGTPAPCRWGGPHPPAGPSRPCPSRHGATYLGTRRIIPHCAHEQRVRRRGREDSRPR